MKLRLLTKMILFILLPAIIGLMLVSGIGYYQSSNILVSQLQGNMQLVVQTQTSGWKQYIIRSIRFRTRFMIPLPFPPFGRPATTARLPTR